MLLHPMGKGKWCQVQSPPQVQHSPLWTQPIVEKKSTIAVAQRDLPLIVLATLSSAIILGANRKPRGGQATSDDIGSQEEVKKGLWMLHGKAHVFLISYRFH